MSRTTAKEREVVISNSPPLPEAATCNDKWLTYLMASEERRQLKK